MSVAEKCGAVVTAEEHSVIGGLGSAVAEVLAGRSGAKVARVGKMCIRDSFGGDELLPEAFFGGQRQRKLRACRGKLAAVLRVWQQHAAG